MVSTVCFKSYNRHDEIKKILFTSETQKILSSMKLDTVQIGDCWDVRQCFVRQFKTDYVRLIEGLVFGKKKKKFW